MKKGFTLIEVISAVVILSIIALIVIPIVNRNISESRQKLYNRQVVTIEQAAQKWFINNADSIDDNDFPYSLTLATLKASGLIEKGDIKNPSDDSIMNGCVVISFDSSYNQNVYNYVDTCPSDEPEEPEDPNATPEYITSGLLVWYDGILNSGLDQSHKDNTTDWSTWTDLSGNNNHGILTNITFGQDSGWGSDYLHLDGVNDFVKMPAINKGNITLEAVIKYDVIPTSGAASMVLANVESGGYGLTNYNGSAYVQNNGFMINIDGTYNGVISNVTFTTNRFYSLSGSYNSNTITFYENALKYTLVNPGNITTTASNTVMVAGANPGGATPSVGSFFNGRIYSIRIYNRALTEAEVLHNYQIDRDRFGF